MANKISTLIVLLFTVITFLGCHSNPKASQNVCKDFLVYYDGDTIIQGYKNYTPRNGSDNINTSTYLIIPKVQNTLYGQLSCYSNYARCFRIIEKKEGYYFEYVFNGQSEDELDGPYSSLDSAVANAIHSPILYDILVWQGGYRFKGNKLMSGNRELKKLCDTENDSAMNTTEYSLRKQDESNQTTTRPPAGRESDVITANDNLVGSFDSGKAIIFKNDSTIWIAANMKFDYRIFGYEKPDTSSRKLILISIFTNDVEKNPFNCPFGSYYQTSDINNFHLKYISNEGEFIKAMIIKNEKITGTIYISKNWVQFEE